LNLFDETGFCNLFDGATLAGWHAEPRIFGALYPGGPSAATLYAADETKPLENPESHPAAWHVEDAAIVGQQATPGYGGYLVSDDTYGDFELVLEARPDWPADTGIMVRRKAGDWTGFQVLLDHRESGGIGGIFGNGLASFAAVPFAIHAKRDAQGRVFGLEADDPATSLEPVTPDKIALLSYAARVEDFLAVWKWGDWNEFRIRCVGELPNITTWVNGLKIAELDTAGIKLENYDPQVVRDYLGRRGHLAFEVHDNDSHFGEGRWGVGAKCRWRKIRIRTFC
jgi:Domain of Unknown Function (DUF1080)